MKTVIVGIALGAYSSLLARGLAGEDRVTLVLDSGEGRQLMADFPDFYDQPGLTTRLSTHYAFPDPRKLIQAARLLSWMRRSGPEVIHIQAGRTHMEVLWALERADRAGTPLVATIHDVAVHPGDRVDLKGLYAAIRQAEMADQIVVHSSSMASVLTDTYGFDERSLAVAPHGNYDIYRFGRGNRPLPEPVPGRVLFFGRMKRYKGLATLIEAAPLAAEQCPELKIVLAGRGEDLDAHRPRLEGDPLFEIRDRFIPNPEVGPLFASADVVVCPYVEASQSGPLNLAFSFGRPVAATTVGAFPETITDGIDGLLAPPRDPAALAEALVRLIKDRELNSRLARASRAKAQGPLNWDGELAGTYRGIYRKAMDLRRRGIRHKGMGHTKRLAIARRLAGEVTGQDREATR